jgi:hypothetical protein
MQHPLTVRSGPQIGRPAPAQVRALARRLLRGLSPGGPGAPRQAPAPPRAGSWRPSGHGSSGSSTNWWIPVIHARPVIAGTIASAPPTAVRPRIAPRSGCRSRSRSRTRRRLRSVAGIRGEFSEQERLTAEAAALAEQAGDRDAHVNLPHLNLAAALAGPTASTRPSTLRTGRRTYERLGMQLALAHAHLYAPYPKVWSGAWDDRPGRVRDRRRACVGDGRRLAGRRPRGANGHPRPARPSPSRVKTPVALGRSARNSQRKRRDGSKRESRSSPTNLLLGTSRSCPTRRSADCPFLRTKQ